MQLAIDTRKRPKTPVQTPVNAVYDDIKPYSIYITGINRFSHNRLCAYMRDIKKTYVIFTNFINFTIYLLTHDRKY